MVNQLLKTVEKIKEILGQGKLSIEELIICLEEVKENGDVAVIKFDGQRSIDQYTVFISFEDIRGRDMIRSDGDNLKDALTKVLSSYIEND